MCVCEVEGLDRTTRVENTMTSACTLPSTFRKSCMTHDYRMQRLMAFSKMRINDKYVNSERVLGGELS